MARRANPDNLDIKPAVSPAPAGTNCFPLKTLDFPYLVRIPHILMILHTGENSNSSAKCEFSAVKRLAAVTHNGLKRGSPALDFESWISKF
jgi:hypothetical protein